MPELYRVQILGDLADLIPDFGLVGPVPAWWVSDTVIPVALVNSQVTLSSVATPLLYTVTQSAGETATPGAGTRLANTGQLAAGNYAFRIWAAANESNNFHVAIRNATDTADIWRMRFLASLSNPLQLDITWTLVANERLVVENVNAGGGGTVYQARVFRATI